MAPPIPAAYACNTHTSEARERCRCDANTHAAAAVSAPRAPPARDACHVTCLGVQVLWVSADVPFVAKGEHVRFDKRAHAGAPRHVAGAVVGARLTAALRSRHGHKRACACEKAGAEGRGEGCVRAWRRSVLVAAVRRGVCSAGAGGCACAFRAPRRAPRTAWRRRRARGAAWRAHAAAADGGGVTTARVVRIYVFAPASARAAHAARSTRELRRVCTSEGATARVGLRRARGERLAALDEVAE
jgi:hypothetical protein